ncbi:MAG TPA: hypothetical protein VFA07_04400 [Chthonomonadaceae bacterium]|nr:hypothetical protein [Chthonomonadaceae bacterium]
MGSVSSTKRTEGTKSVVQELLDTVEKYAWLGVLLFAFGWAYRLGKFVSEHAINCLFGDAWDYTTPLFRHANPLVVFRWQHGPHREGIGLLFEWAVYTLTRWNTRAVDFAMVGLVALAMGVAIVLRYRLAGRLQWSDLLLPLLFCNLGIWESVTIGSHVAHSVMPLLLVMLTGGAWLIPKRVWRYRVVAILNVAAVYTGFALFLGLLNPILLAIEIWRLRGKKEMRAALGALIAVLLTDGSFLIGYAFGQVQGRFEPWPMARFMATLFAYFFKADLAFGYLLLAAMVAACLAHGARWIREEKPESLLICLFTGFTLLFALECAYGRVANGTEYAQTSRYLCLVTPGMVGLYLAALALPHWSLRLCGVGVLFWLAYVGRDIPGREQYVMEVWQRGRADWITAYKQTGSVGLAGKMAHLTMDPHPELSHMDEKLAYLKAHQLNLFAP